MRISRWAATAAVLAGAVALALLLFVFAPAPSTPDVATDYDTPLAELTDPAADPAADDPVARRSEKSRRMKAPTMGYPDLFAEHHAGIRTAPGDAAPAYPMNYRIDQLTRLRTAKAAKGGATIDQPWVERGPANVGGRTRAIVVDPDDPTNRTWIAGGVGGGLWKTSDAGQNWTNLTPDLPNLAITALVQAPSNPDVLFAGTGEGFGNTDAISGAGLFKSTDRGQTWTQLGATINPDFRAVNRLVINPNNAGVVLAATNTGIFRSQNGGSSWTAVYRRGEVSGNTGGRIQQIVANPFNFNVLYATENSVGVLKSNDSGATWALSSLDGFPGSFGRIEIAIAPTQPTRIYAAAEAAESQLYVSDDAGLTWTPLVEVSAANDPNWLCQAGGSGCQGWYDNAIAVHPYSADTLFVGGIRLWKMSRFTAGGTREVNDFTELVEDGTQPFLSFVNFNSGTVFGGRMATGLDVGATNISESDFVSVEMRFGPGKSQMAHRFTVSATGGTNGDGGAGVGFGEYQYADYVEVPFEMWDTENNRQLMVSFRDQGDNGVFDLIETNTEGERDSQSREYFFVHAEPYSATTPIPQVAQNGGLTYRMLYFMWPFLTPGGTWDASALPEADLRILFESFEAQLRISAAADLGNGPHVDHHHLTLIPTDAASNSFTIINGNDGGVYYSENSGDTWLGTLNGYNTTQFYGADKKPGFDVYIGGTQDNGTWRSFGSPSASSGWIFSVGGDGFDVAWHAEDDKKIVASSQFNGIVRTVDGGINWTSGTTGHGDVGADNGGQFITSIAKTNASPNLLFSMGVDGIWRSTDFAESWQLMTHETDKWGPIGSGKVRISEANPDIVWAGFRMDETGRLHVSTNRGLTFQGVNNPPGVSGRISGLATHPTEPNTAFALFSQFGNPKIYRTTDLGETWEDLSGYENSTDGTSTNGFPDVAVLDLLVLPERPQTIWAGTEIGLFISFDNGGTWEFDDSFPAVSIWQMRVAEDEVVMATHGRGVWTVDLNAVATDTEPTADGTLPATFNLGQNYPNPFNPATTIEFALPRAENVKITVFDVAGRQVATLANGDFTAGTHQVAWNAGHLASGVYLYRLQAGDFVQTRKLTLLK